MPQNTPYLKYLAGRRGWYFQRAVPRDLHTTIGKKTWIYKAGDSLADARRAVADFLTMTDAEIAQARGVVTTKLIQHLDQSVKEGEDLGDLSPDDLFPRHDEDAQQRLFRRVQDLSKGVKPKGRSAEDLINLATRLKQPAPSTSVEWLRHLTAFLQLIRKDDITDVSKADVQQYRDHLLDTCAASTTKTRLRYVGGLFEIALEEEWIEVNPFAGITKRIKTKRAPKEVVSLAATDAVVEKLPQAERWLYLLMRYTGLHVSEAGGIRVEDIDLDGGILHIRSNKLRPLKNEYRVRDLPITDKLRPVLEEIVQTLKVEQGHILPGMYNAAQARWAPALGWTAKIGVSPKACRDNCATVLRDEGFNERVIGAILGHTPKSQTGVYGSVTMEAKRSALEKL